MTDLGPNIKLQHPVNPYAVAAVFRYLADGMDDAINGKDHYFSVQVNRELTDEDLAGAWMTAALYMASSEEITIGTLRQVAATIDPVVQDVLFG